MNEKERKKDNRNTEIEKVEIPEVEHQTVHPGEAEFSLQNDNFAPAENDYLNENHQS